MDIALSLSRLAPPAIPLTDLFNRCYDKVAVVIAWHEAMLMSGHCG